MDSNTTMGTMLYQISLPILIFSYMELYFFTNVIHKDTQKDIDRILNDVNIQLTNEYKQQLQTGKITNERFLTRMYESTMMLSKMKSFREDDMNNNNRYLKKLSYYLLFVFSLIVLFLASRVKNDMDVFDIGNVLSGHVMVNTTLMLMFASVFQYSFYKHFIKQYKCITSEEIVSQILQKLLVILEVPDDFECKR